MTQTKCFLCSLLLSLAIGPCGVAVAQQEAVPNLADLKTPVTQEETPAEQPKPSPVPAEAVRRRGTVITPASSISRPGKGAHTNYKIFVPEGHQISSAVPDVTYAETPASIGCVYNVGPIYTGCAPSTTSKDHPTGGWGAIVLVDAYDDTHAASDLAYFDTYYGLPTAKFAKIYANSSYGTLNGLTASCSGTPPPAATYGWDLEESLDIEWSHTMAPSATIVLVEACTQNLPDLLFAEEVAGFEAVKYGGGDVSNSWGYPESSVGVPADGGGTMTEQEDDNFFFRYYWADVTYFASAGDSGAEVLYPSASPWVVSVGGTTINRNSSEDFVSESCWADSGGGPSAVETWASPPTIAAGMGPWANYQYPLFGQGARVTPDISFDADPNSGVYVYDTDEGGAWYIVGGTSLSSPAVAGLVNASNNRLGMATSKTGGFYVASELNLLYSQLNTNAMYASNFYDVKTGSNGHAAASHYDECTGIGSPRGYDGK